MKNTLAITLSLLFSCIIWTGCSNSTLPNEEINTSWVFVANEGNFGASNGSISMIDDRGFVHETEAIGDVVQSLEVYEDKLIVLINNSHMIKVYDISGRQIKTLFNDYQAAGYHSISWNGSSYPSGLYFIRISFSNFKHTEKVLLIK